MYLKLGFRNLLRNKRRTLIAGSAIGIGLAALIFTDGLMLGMERNLIRSATRSFLGEGQIHRDGYRELPEVEKTVANLSELLESLEQDRRIAEFTPRAISLAMITSPTHVNAVQLIGVDPESERKLSQIDDAMREGTYFEGDSRRDLVIGSKLAELLEVEIGSRVVVTVSEAGSGALSQEMFRISGIYHFNDTQMDRRLIVARLPVVQAMLALPGEVHEIALQLSDSSLARDPSASLWIEYSRGPNEAVGWTILLPQLDMALDLSQFSIFIMGLILFSVVALGIINTLFMSMHERMFEFGVLRAVGTRPVQMGLMVVSEAGALAVVAIFLGSALGLAVTSLIASMGIDYTGIEAMGVTFRELLYPVVQLRQFVVYPAVLLLLTLLISLYPATHSARLNPADAMRRSF